MPVRVTAAQRRARLAVRHLQRRATVDEVLSSHVALHSSDPASPFLAAWARIDGFGVGDLEAALYERRSLWRLHAMRRTLFVVRRADAEVFHAAVGAAVAAKERARLARWMGQDASERTVKRRLARGEDAILAALSDGHSHSTKDLSASLPELAGDVAIGSGRWAGRTPLAGKLLSLLAMELKIVRARPAGSWRSSQYQWVETGAWFGEKPAAVDEAEGRNRLLARYLANYGPVTALDIRWWTGWGVRQTEAAVKEIEAQPVDLEGEEGWVAAGDTTFRARARRSVTLLPGLDQTPMGWKNRSWFVGDHGRELFDRNGNIGPTVWIAGRIVGGWGQRPDGRVVTRLLEPVTDAARRAVDRRAGELSEWLDGTVVTPRFPTPLQRQLGAG